MVYADVIIDISHEKVDRDFQYRIPEELEPAIKPGVVVTVPFGKGNTLRKGYVIGTSTEAKYDASKTKEIQGVSTDSETTESRLIALAAWMKETYGSTMIQALKTVLPVKDKVRAKEKKLIFFTGEKARAQKLLEELEGSRFKARERFLRAILEAGSLDYTYASKELGASISVLDFFEKKGLIKIESQEMYRIPKNSGLVTFSESGTAGSRCRDFSGMAETGTETCTSFWSDRKRKDAGLHEADPGSTGRGKTGHCADSGNCTYLSDSPAFLCHVWR